MFIVTLTKHDPDKPSAWYNKYPIGTSFIVEKIEYNTFTGKRCVFLTQENINNCSNPLPENHDLSLENNCYYFLPIESCTIREDNLSKYISLILNELID
jgi:hypothetical protein